MKDLPHHIKKLNRRIIRSIHHLEEEEANFDSRMPSPPAWKETASSARKKTKAKLRKERESRPPVHKSAEERNWEMKHRVPVFDRTSHPRPKAARPTHKKTPRI